MGAFDDYTSAGQSKGGAFDDYSPPASAPTTVGGYVMNLLTKEATPGSGLGASADEGIVPAARDYALAGLDDASMGWLVPNSLQDATKQAHSNLGFMDYPVAAASYALGPGKILGAGREAAGITKGVLSGTGVMGTAAEGALANTVSGAGHGDQGAGLLADAATGAALGTGGGVIAKAVNPIVRGVGNAIGRLTGALKDPAAVTAALKADQQAKYDALDGIKYDPGDLKAGADYAHSQVYGGDDGTWRAATPQTNRILTKYSQLMDQAATNGQDGSASGLHTAIKDLKGVAGGGGADSVAASQALPHMRGMFDALTPTSGPANAGDLLRQADEAHSLFKNASALQDMSQNLSDWQANPAPQARDISRFYPPSPPGQPTSPQRSALINIYRSGGGGGQTPYNVMHMIDPLLGYAGASVAGGPGAIAGELAGHALKPTIGGALGFLNRQATQRAIQDAYPDLTGAVTSYKPDVGALLTSMGRRAVSN